MNMVMSEDLFSLVHDVIKAAQEHVNHYSVPHVGPITTSTETLAKLTQALQTLKQAVN